MNNQEKQELVDSYEWWFHSIDFGDNIISKGRVKSIDKHLKQEKYFPEDFFKNKRVLDVGCWDGYYSFYAERMGASEIVAVDTWKYGKLNRKNKTGFNIAKKILNSRVQDFVLDINEATPEMLGGKFDSIIYMGVIYHQKNPYLSLEIIDSLLLNGGRILIETAISNSDMKIPVMQFTPKNTRNKDPTNFWSPNLLCVQKMLEEIGEYSIDKTVVLNQGRGYLIARKK